MIEEIYREWCENTKDDPFVHGELVGLTEAEIEDRFYRDLAFGTGGLRGVIGAGTNRMNVYTVARATAGLADYLNETCGGRGGVVIAYDSRRMSREFAFVAGRVLSSKGIAAQVFSTLTPTPVLSFAVRECGAAAGIVITASHNPKEYNGYKVYNERGCQITDEAAAAITAHIEKNGYFGSYEERAPLTVLGDDVLHAFLDRVLMLSCGMDPAFAPSVVYTPLHGTGNLPVRRLLERMGLKDVAVLPEQELPDPDFTTCPYPNPEVRAALEPAIAYAQKSGADLVLATDPDADRVGIAVRDERGEYRLFTGNETGVLLENFLLAGRGKTLPGRPVVVKTIVTTDMAAAIARAYGAELREVLTGFKYIGETIDRLDDPRRFLMGLEESYGYLIGGHARDKDAVSACMAIVEMAAYYGARGKSLIDALDELYRTYGYYRTALISKSFPGKAGKEEMQARLDRLRAAPWQEILSAPVRAKDYLPGVDGLPKSDVLSFTAEKFKLIVRPSGTEPKMKIYLETKGKTAAESESLLAALTKFVNAQF